jgi:hypothetical protein
VRAKRALHDRARRRHADAEMADLALQVRLLLRRALVVARREKRLVDLPDDVAHEPFNV